jgi:hypothetical protein
MRRQSLAHAVQYSGRGIGGGYHLGQASWLAALLPFIPASNESRVLGSYRHEASDDAGRSRYERRQRGEHEVTFLSGTAVRCDLRLSRGPFP